MPRFSHDISNISAHISKDANAAASLCVHASLAYSIINGVCSRSIDANAIFPDGEWTAQLEGVPARTRFETETA